MRRETMIGVVGIAALLSSAGAAFALNDEDPKDIIAAQIRDQGFDCDDPQSATRDDSASGPDEAAWVVTCEGASYRVKLVPDMAAKIEKIDQKKDQKEEQKTNP